jgi:hypothetical protein
MSIMSARAPLAAPSISATIAFMRLVVFARGSRTDDGDRRVDTIVSGTPVR